MASSKTRRYREVLSPVETYYGGNDGPILGRVKNNTGRFRDNTFFDGKQHYAVGSYNFFTILCFHGMHDRALFYAGQFLWRVTR